MACLLTEGGEDVGVVRLLLVMRLVLVIMPVVIARMVLVLIGLVGLEVVGKESD